ncbi:hypothetical protein D0T51_07635 [Parabacteroides sp. 52]|uniref:Mfa1 family fimbria major subunit n=1 Tax=unclassified Parabacteroides TaxID=2649774 RepID=UPI0013D3DB5D|nr:MULTISPECIES: Mfa1 family fimbria major subunit [unclassified Parabacteroides]MDH6534881.1 hypothetical protein [Parabacteroides sp. PM5-20]NDV55598.1 hypothetical protein [Parabacteroides sp. 52]
MRVKLIHVLCTLAIGMSFFSCESDLLREKQQPEESSDAERNAYISFDLAVGADRITRAETEEGLVKEQKVSSVYLLLFGGAGPEAPLHYCFKLKASTDGSTDFAGEDVLVAETTYTGPGKGSFRSKAKPIRKADYQLVVLANLQPGKIKPVLPGAGVDLKTLLDDIASANEGEVGESILSDNALVERYKISNLITNAVSGNTPSDFFNASSESEFMMTNANGILFIEGEQLQTSSVHAEAAPFYIHLDRVVAKVLVRRGGNYQTKKGTLDEIHGLTWGVVRTNRLTYLVRNLNYLSDPFGAANNYQSIDKETISSGLNPALSGNALPARKYTYAIDPNYDAEVSGASDYDSYPATMYSWNLSPTCIGQNAGDTYQYIFENTISLHRQSADNWRDYVTQIEVNAFITHPGGLTATDYYSFKTPGGEARVFTHTQANMWWIYDMFPAEMDGLSIAIAKDEALPVGERQFDFYASQPSGAFRNSFGITYHPGGLNKYRIPIKHFYVPDITDAETARKTVYGHYGVVRNNVYAITIHSITGPGDGLTDQYISADVTVNPWWVRTWDEEVKYE